MSPCALLMAALVAGPFLEHDDLTGYDTIRIADRIFGFIPRHPETPVVSGNSVAVIGDDGVLVVDSGHYPSATRKMIAQIKTELAPGKPVRYLVNTHWHGDHNKGNALYRDAFPGIAIVSTEATRKQYDNRFITDELGIMKEQAEQVQKSLSSRALNERQAQYLGEALHELETLQEELGSVRVVRPDLTFEDQLTAHLGNRDVLVRFLGRGNTAGDAVIYVPDAKVLMTGDLVVYPAPYAFGSFIGEWGPTLRKVMALDATTIVPGHGPVMHDKTYLSLLAETFETVSAQVKRAAKEGLSLEEAKKKLDFQKLRERFSHGDEKVARGFDGFFLGPGLPRAYREAKEGPLHDET